MDNVINLKTLVKKFNCIYNVDINPETWTVEYCEKLLEAVLKNKNKIIKESYYHDIINNKKYFKLILLENICKQRITEIYTTKRKVKNRKKDF